jgi:hypothetical protein
VPKADRGLHEKVWELLVGDSFLWAMLLFLVGVTMLLEHRRRTAATTTDTRRSMRIGLLGEN